MMSANRLRGYSVGSHQERRPNIKESLLLIRCILQCLLRLRNNIEKTEYLILVQLYGDCLVPGFYLEQFEEPGYVLPSLERFKNFPAGSLGKVYADYMGHLLSDGCTDVTTYERLAMQVETAEGLALRKQFADKRRTYRFAVTSAQHDFYHVLTNLDTHRVDELCLQAFTYGQIGNGGNLSLIFFGVLDRLKHLDWSSARLILQSIQFGKQAKPLCTVDWDTFWEQPIFEVRANLGIKSKNLPDMNNA